MKALIYKVEGSIADFLVYFQHPTKEQILDAMESWKVINDFDHTDITPVVKGEKNVINDIHGFDSIQLIEVEPI